MILSGWLKLHRPMMQHAVWSLPDAQFKVWVTILIEANHRDRDWWDRGERVTIAAGSLVRSQRNLADDARVGRQVVRDALRNLENIGSIRTHKRTQQKLLIEVANWPTYQGVDTDENPEENPRGTQQEPSRNPTGRMKEGKKKNSSANGLPPGFAEWWVEYPKKVGKIQAVREWEKLGPDEALQAVMLEALRKQRWTVKAMVESDRNHILDPERWIKYRRWEDETPPAASGAPRYPQL